MDRKKVVPAVTNNGKSTHQKKKRAKTKDDLRFIKSSKSEATKKRGRGRTQTKQNTHDLP